MADCCDSNCSNVVLPVGDTGPQGPQGNPGTNGTNGTTLLGSEVAERGSNTTYIENTLTTNEEIIAPFIPANTMENDGDLLEIDAIFYLNKAASGTDVFYNITLGGQVIFTTGLLRRNVIECVKLKFIIARNGDSTASVFSDYQEGIFLNNTNSSIFSSGKVSLIKPISLTGLDFTTNLAFSVKCTADGVGLFRISQFIGTLKTV